MITADPNTDTMPKRTSTRPAPHRKATAAGIDRLVLTGYMGSGKTTIGRLIAEQLGWAFLDLDTEIERRCGLTVPQIFADLGEPHFRRQEAAALASVLGRSRIVIALGGGAPENFGNQLLLEQTPNTAVVFLSAPFATLYDRCQQQAGLPGTTERPVLADRQTAESRFQTRQRIYARIASHTVETATLSPQKTVEILLNDLFANRI